MLIWILGLLSVILMIAMGLPIAFSMLTIGFFGLVILIGFSPSLAMIGQIFFDNGMNYTLSILPLFLFKVGQNILDNLKADLNFKLNPSSHNLSLNFSN